eukprot:1007154-Ditylum_brightwellii.AAC.1
MPNDELNCLCDEIEQFIAAAVVTTAVGVSETIDIVKQKSTDEEEVNAGNIENKCVYGELLQAMTYYRDFVSAMTVSNMDPSKIHNGKDEEDEKTNNILPTLHKLTKELSGLNTIAAAAGVDKNNNGN